MSWAVSFHPEFADEFAKLGVEVRIEIAASALLLERFGPQLSRPHADTLKASKHPNMKEIGFSADQGGWRLAFAFDPRRSAILLVAADESGVAEKRFYKQLIATADRRFAAHRDHLEKESRHGDPGS